MNRRELARKMKSKGRGMTPNKREDTIGNRRGMASRMKSKGRGMTPTEREDTIGNVRGTSAKAKTGLTRRKAVGPRKPVDRAEPVVPRSSRLAGGGMAKKKMAGGGSCGSKKGYAKGGKVRGAGVCKKGVRPAKMV